MTLSMMDIETVTIDSLKPVIKRLYAETGILTMNDYNKRPVVLTYMDNMENKVSTNLHKKHVRSAYDKRGLYRKPVWHEVSMFLTKPNNCVCVSGSYLASIKVGPRHLNQNEILEQEYQYPEGYNILDHTSTFYDGTASLDLPNDFVGRIEFALHYKDKSKIVYCINRAYPDPNRHKWSSGHGYTFSYDNTFRGTAIGKVVINFVDFQ